MQGEGRLVAAQPERQGASARTSSTEASPTNSFTSQPGRHPAGRQTRGGRSSDRVRGCARSASPSEVDPAATDPVLARRTAAGGVAARGAGDGEFTTARGTGRAGPRPSRGGGPGEEGARRRGSRQHGTRWPGRRGPRSHDRDRGATASTRISVWPRARPASRSPAAGRVGSASPRSRRRAGATSTGSARRRSGSRSGQFTRSAKVGGPTLTCEADCSVSGSPRSRDRAAARSPARSAVVSSPAEMRRRAAAATRSISVEQIAQCPRRCVADGEAHRARSRGTGSRSRSCSTTSARRDHAVRAPGPTCSRR